MAADEQVMVVERKVVEEVGMFQGLTFDVDRYLDRLLQGKPQFMPRPEAEQDPSHKQLIPYVIMMHDGKVLSYVRGKRAGEKRLVGNRSIGIGGHINPVDDMPLFSFHDIYAEAVAREIQEEVEINANHTDKIVALINDDATEVGQVHLGVVHLWTLDNDDVTRREQMITQVSFMTPAELNDVRDTMETWSSLCLDGLDEMMKRA